jgi:hypothetical protein
MNGVDFKNIIGKEFEAEVLEVIKQVQRETFNRAKEAIIDAIELNLQNEIDINSTNILGDFQIGIEWGNQIVIDDYGVNTDVLGEIIMNCIDTVKFEEL